MYLILSDVGINWSDLMTLSRSSVNWTDVSVQTRARVNWTDLNVLSRTGINWDDFNVLSRAGLNWAGQAKTHGADNEKGVPSPTEAGCLPRRGARECCCRACPGTDLCGRVDLPFVGDVY